MVYCGNPAAAHAHEAFVPKKSWGSFVGSAVGTDRTAAVLTGVRWLEEEAVALLPFPLDAAKNTGRIKGHRPAKEDGKRKKARCLA